MRRILLRSAAAIALASAFLSPSAVRAQGTPVIDMTAIMNLVKTVQSMTQQVGLLTNITSTNGQILTAVGATGARPEIAPANLWADFAGGGPGVQALAKFTPDTCAPTACASTGWAKPTLSDYAGTATWAGNAFYLNANPSAVDAQNLAEVRARAVREAAISGYALSLTSRDLVAKAGPKVTELEGIAKAATDLRGDMRANTAVQIANYGQGVQQLALLSSLVQMAAIRQISGDANVSSVSTTAKPALVRNEKEYNNANVRVSAGGGVDSNSGASAGATFAPDVPIVGPGGGGSPSVFGGGASTPSYSPGATIPASSMPSVLGQGIQWSPAVTAAAQGIQISPTTTAGSGSQLQALAQIGAALLSANGNTGLATAVSALGAVAGASQPNPYGTVWAGGNTLAVASGNPQLSQTVMLGQSAASSGNATQMGQIMALAGQAAANSGNPDAMRQFSQIQNGYAIGSLTQQDAALGATYVATQYGGYGSAGTAVAGALNQNTTGATQAQMNAYSLGVMQQAGQLSPIQVPTYQGFTTTATQNQGILFSGTPSGE